MEATCSRWRVYKHLIPDVRGKMTEILNAMKPCGLALLDYYNGQEDAVLTVRREDGDARAIRVQAFFRVSTALAIDQKALDVCHGRVLDVGAGTGIHSLALQGQGVEVCAIDVLPEACEIMRKRGLKDVHCADFRRFAAAKRFDTILILGRGLGMVETRSRNTRCSCRTKGLVM